MTKLGELIERYYNLKTEMESYKKQVDADNKEIKRIMNDSNMAICESGDLTATCQEIVSESFDEDKLLSCIKGLGLNSCIKTKEYVDMDILESLIYNGEIDPKQLSDCKITKTQTRLTVRRKK